jgi:hypothetical protein
MCLAGQMTRMSNSTDPNSPRDLLSTAYRLTGRIAGTWLGASRSGDSPPLGGWQWMDGTSSANILVSYKGAGLWATWEPNNSGGMVRHVHCYFFPQPHDYRCCDGSIVRRLDRVQFAIVMYLSCTGMWLVPAGLPDACVPLPDLITCTYRVHTGAADSWAVQCPGGPRRPPCSRCHRHNRKTELCIRESRCLNSTTCG